MTEAKLQAKVVKELEKEGWYVVRIIAASKAGVPDLITCDPDGRFVAFEVKWGRGKTSKLQNYNIEQIRKRKGVAHVVYSLEELRQILSKHNRS